jgi:hypothetical protein
MRREWVGWRYPCPNHGSKDTRKKKLTEAEDLEQRRLAYMRALNAEARKKAREDENEKSETQTHSE